MTERLHQLMVRETDDLDIPTPPADAVLRAGRRTRRRRALGLAAAGLAAVVVVGGTGFALTGGDGPDTAPDAADAGSAGGAYAVGNQVFLDGGGRSVTVDDKSVKSLYYTSAGVLVRQGDNPYSDGGGAQRFSLVRDDGSISPVDVQIEETVHNTDPDQPYVVYGERGADGVLDLVVHDVAADEEAARVPIPGAKGDWFPVALSGDTAYLQAGYDGTVYEVEWRTGAVGRTDAVDHALEVHGDHALVDRGRRVIDLASGDELLSVPEGGWPSFSPDGRYVVVGSTVHDLDDGSKADLEDGDRWGWTADGDPFRVDVEASQVVTCDAETGDCSAADVDLPGADGGAECEPVDRGDAVEACSQPDGGIDVILGGVIRES